MSQLEPSPQSFEDDAESSHQKASLPLYDVSREPSRLTGPRQNASANRGGSPPSLYVLAANKMGYGSRPGQKAEWNALGVDDETRFAAYIDQQLDPMSIVDTDFDSRRASAGYQTLDLGLHALWRDYERDLPGATNSDDPQEEAEVEWFLRGIYSKRQLEHRMIEFWSDHFNVDSDENYSESVWPHWLRTLQYKLDYPIDNPPVDHPDSLDQDLLLNQSAAFGNFRDLLWATAHHPAMLYYLDQYTSTFAGPNENYCREMIELHTFGAENYLGVLPQGSVPNTKWAAKWDNADPVIADLYPSGFPDGYVDNDIFASALSFTGWTFEFGDDPGTSGRYFFNSDSNLNTASSAVLSFGFNNILSSLAMPKRGDRILNMLAYHPATAQYISGKLVRRFISDDAPQSLIDSTAAVFFDNKYAPNQLELVMRHILNSTEFRDSFGGKIKRPYDVVVSMLRATQGDLDWSLDGDETGNFLNHFSRTGHRPFRWRSPDGYPDQREKWETAAPRVMTWRVGQHLADIRKDNGALFMPIRLLTPGSVDRTPNALADFWIGRFLPQGVSAEFREEVVDFLGQGFNPDTVLNIEDNNSTEWRVQMMIPLLMASPEFCER